MLNACFRNVLFVKLLIVCMCILVVSHVVHNKMLLLCLLCIWACRVFAMHSLKAIVYLFSGLRTKIIFYAGRRRENKNNYLKLDKDNESYEFNFGNIINIKSELYLFSLLLKY